MRLSNEDWDNYCTCKCSYFKSTERLWSCWCRIAFKHGKHVHSATAVHTVKLSLMFNHHQHWHTSCLVHVPQLCGLLCVFQGNDQIRFELTCYALYPEVQVSWPSDSGDVATCAVQNRIYWCCCQKHNTLTHCLCGSDHSTVEDPWVLHPLPGEKWPHGVCTGNSTHKAMNHNFHRKFILLVCFSLLFF